jgi:hypothetical protein
MNSAQGRFDHEDWLWKTYGEGVRDALKDQPGRQFCLIHRYHQTSKSKTLETFKDYPGPVDFSFKYPVAHRYSERNPPFIAPVLTEMPDKMRTWLEVRNDDIYSFRWGDPDFARAYINKIPGPDRVAGFNMGPDGGFVAKFGEEATQATPWIPCTMNAAVFSPKPPARAVTTGTAIKAASGVIRLPRIKPSRIAMVAKPRMAGMALVCPDQNSAGRM